MIETFGCSPTDIRAAIGPGISKCCYETGQDVADAIFRTLGEAAQSCVTAHGTLHGEKYLVDLKETNRLLLNKAGVIDIIVSDECTSCQNDKYWSHRRTNGRRGSQTAIIVKSGESP